jgi:nucleotide-binding universal stress UspA family protein
MNMPVVVAVDEDTKEEVLLEAEQLATDRDLQLHVVHVISESTFKNLEETNIKDTGQPVDLETVRKFAAEVGEQVASGILSEYTSVGLEGDEPTRIVQYLQEVDAEYAVVGVHKRSPVGKAIFGSVSQSILLNADCPVLAVRTT